MIKFQNVTKTYPEGYTVLRDISFEVNKGEFVSIVGKSGAGKTTITRLILGLDHPTVGDVYCKNIKIANASKNILRQLRRSIGAVYQDYKLLPNRSVYDNVAYVMSVEGKSNNEIAHNVDEVLNIIGLKDKEGKLPTDLSGGEQQRLAIARAIVTHPDIIIADEPTGNLDPYNTYEVMQILKKLNERGKTVILATHNRDIVNKMQKRVITIDNGKIIRDEAEGKFVI